MNVHVPALQRSLPDVVAEYDAKLAVIDDAVAAFNAAGEALKTAATMFGEWGDTSLDYRGPSAETLKRALLKSAWKHVYSGLNIDRIASANDKRKWSNALDNPAPFTLDNIRATLGDYHLNPRQHILRGLAEVFCALDQSYKSHDKVKIGVAGLPKRIIIPNVTGWGSYGRDKVRDVINALAAYRGLPMLENEELKVLDDLHSYVRKLSGDCVIRGLHICKFQNGNAHIIFDRDTQRDINKALAEFYGEVLPDAAGEKPAQRAASTAVSRDLQYYPTPQKLAEDVITRRFSDRLTGKLVLDPSCGDGRLMAAAHKLGAKVHGVEVDPVRAAVARARFGNVMTANFLEVQPEFYSVLYDIVYMNPPFYGRHYAKHVRHAMRFLKPGGHLLAILPITAREHGELDDLMPASRYSDPWHDLPVASFSESGTNVNTTTLLLRKPG